MLKFFVIRLSDHLTSIERERERSDVIVQNRYIDIYYTHAHAHTHTSHITHKYTYTGIQRKDTHTHTYIHTHIRNVKYDYYI